jgi:glycerol-3-phosphate acyltransferase PlsX
MGGDLGPRLCISAALKFSYLHPSVRLTLVGDKDLLAASAPDFPDRIKILPAEDSVEMSDRPSNALRHKRDSSMALAVKMVATNEADACVSGGNTGALMAFGLHMLGTIPGVERPAICKAVPGRDGVCWVLDLGANLECSAEHLRQFACMGVSLAKLHGVARPRVALLNIGVEELKGRELERETAILLRAQSNLNFVGFVEGGDIFRGAADVVVCDGFTGNVLLKASEGAAELLQSSLKAALLRGAGSRLAGWLIKPVLRPWVTRYDPARLNGASLLGLNGVVVKSHGSASEEGFLAALNVAREQAVHRMIDTVAAVVAG